MLRRALGYIFQNYFNCYIITVRTYGLAFDAPTLTPYAIVFPALTL